MIKTNPVYYPLYNDKEKFIILITGGRGCEHPDTPVMMADLTIKKIKDLVIGDKVMGDDGTARTVLRLFRGRSNMYKVHQTCAEDYIVNDIHKLVLRKSEVSKREWRYPHYEDVIEMPIEEFIKKGKRFKENFHGYKVGSIPYPFSQTELEPYMLGLWLGDGTSISPRITNADSEVREYLMDYCERHGQTYRETWRRGAWHVSIIGNGKVGGNDFLNKLKKYKLIGNKHIPQEYISNSEEVRLEVLAGLLDTDGYFNKNTYAISQKSEVLARQIKFIADTLGFRTSLKKMRKSWDKKHFGDYYCVYIGGDLWRIPCRVGHKKALEETFSKNKDWRKSHLTIEPLGEGEWCGIMVDGNHRYLGQDGTVKRNSGKSFAVNTFIERMTFEMGYDEEEAKKIAHQILFTRYTMTSASISIIPEFREKIEMDGTERYFRATKSDIENVFTGSRIMFRGIKTSSGNQTAKLKSIHGITTFVVDEAEEWTSEKEFDTMMLSIRKKGIQNRIIIVMNPTDSNHFIYKKYIKDTFEIRDIDGVGVQISTHPNVLHIHTSYLDNKEHCGEQFLKEIEDMKIKDPKKYAHVVIGQWSDVAEGAIFPKFGIVEEFPKEAKRVGAGLDFGYTNDPSACVRCGVIGNDLYLDEVFYKTGMTSTDLIRELRQLGCHVYAESADPRLVDEISLGGVIIYPVQKGGGSIIAGIDKMKTFENIYITKRSYNLHEEFRNYTWAKDKDGNYINEPIDAYNHGIDASRYYVYGKLLGKIMQPKNISKSQLGIY